MQRTILMPDHNFNAIEFTFNTEIVEKLMHFVLDCQDKIISQTYCLDHEILVCMPAYLINYLKETHRIHFGDTEDELTNPYFCGLKLQMSYKNSITVFYNAYIPTQIIKYTQQL